MSIPDFWLLALPYGLVAGCFSSYGTQLNSIFHNAGLSQNDAGRLGLIYSGAGVVAALVTAAAADALFVGRIKAFLTGFQTLMAFCFLWICLMMADVIPLTKEQLVAAFVIFAICQVTWECTVGQKREKTQNK